MKTKVVVTVTETVTIADTDTFGYQLLSKTFEIFLLPPQGHPLFCDYLPVNFKIL